MEIKLKRAVYDLAVTFALLAFVFGSLHFFVQASNLLSYLSDTISDSAPNISADHEFKFTLAHDVPSSGKIIIALQSPLSLSVDTTYRDASLFVDGSVQPLAVASTSTTAGIGILAGQGGTITVTASTSGGYSAGAVIFLTVINHRITNPAQGGAYKIHIQTKDSSGNLIDSGDTLIYIIAPVVAGASSVPASVSPSGPSGNSAGSPGYYSVPKLPTQPLPLPFPLPAPAANVSPPSDADASQRPSVANLNKFSPKSQPINTALGGDIAYHDDMTGSISLHLPGGYSSTPALFSITTISKNTLEASKVNPNLTFAGSNIYKVNAENAEGGEIAVLGGGIKISLEYTLPEVAGLDQDTLTIYSREENSLLWTQLSDNHVDTANHIVTATTGHFSYFALFGKPNSPPASGSASGLIGRIGDLNGDGNTDLADFSILMANWGKPKNPKADINGDGVADILDLSILLYWWNGN